MKNGIMVKVESPMDLLGEIAFLSGYLASMVGTAKVGMPEMVELNKIIEQINPKEDE